MQNLFKNIVCLIVLVLGVYTVSGQVSKFDKVEKVKGTIFNYPPSYDKLMGAKALTPTDIKNIESGKETSVDRTRRLFYVACSRAEESLAIVVYTDSPNVIKNEMIKRSWFKANEITVIS